MTYDDYAALRAEMVSAYANARVVKKFRNGKYREVQDHTVVSMKFGQLLEALAPLWANRDPNELGLVKELFVKHCRRDDDFGRELLATHPSLFPFWIVRGILAWDRITFDPTLINWGWDAFADRYQDAILQA